MNTLPAKNTENTEVTIRPLEELLLDHENPRFGNVVNTKEQIEILDHIVKAFGVNDILSSLSENGYFQSEPLVCEKSRNSNDPPYIVKEGNRRLAACLILTGDERAHNQRERTKSYQDAWKKNGSPIINQVPTILFPNNDPGVLAYLGVRHIAATRVWDSYAKASWIAKVIEADSDIDIVKISNMIGDNQGTIVKMLEGFYLVNQLIDSHDFNPENSIRKGRGSVSQYPFSWVYTIIGYKDVRDYLGLVDGKPETKPLTDTSKGKLLFQSMFGNNSEGKRPAIDDSRELKNLSAIFSDRGKIKMLEKGKSVKEIEENTRPLENQIEDGLLLCRETMKRLTGLISEQKISAQVADSHTGSAEYNKNLATDLYNKIHSYCK